jgi:hypothetical protein
MILEAGDAAATTAHALSALSELCQVYWRPVYVFLRKQGYGREDAQDLTQGFFAHLIENRGYAHADREKGRFSLLRTWSGCFSYRRSGKRNGNWGL